MFLPAFIIVAPALCSLRLSTSAAAVPVTSDGFIIPVALQQSNNNTYSSNTTGLNAIQIENFTNTTNEYLYRYPVPGTKYTLFVSDCTTALSPPALKATFLQGITALDAEIDQGRGALEPDFFSAFVDPILVEWHSSSSISDYRCPYNDLLHLWKALRLVLLDRTTRFPAWLYARVCSCRVNWNGEPGETEAVGIFVIDDEEGEGGLRLVEG
ncbi:hypothetical protein JMJ35_007060 [Cladonia borealis]|uniref:Uncharacterized protein n=1 Tax=Cladonia borealis TaxID=184061 RepID=A0AA39V027_9LECA|nr:hypothetical protein JMJ35_007060 [Cladonia borealis]